MKHKLNSKGQAGTTADACKNAESLMSSQPIANAYVCALNDEYSSFKEAREWKSLKCGSNAPKH